MADRRVLFLDVDGVLNHAGLRERWLETHRVIDEECVARLKRIVDATGCEIVLSSTWRLHHDGRADVAFALKPYRLRLYDWTPDLRATVERWKEIRAWLDRPQNRDVTAFVILDDEQDADVDGRLVQTDFYNGGLRDEHVERCIALLAGTSSLAQPKEP